MKNERIFRTTCTIGHVTEYRAYPTIISNTWCCPVGEHGVCGAALAKYEATSSEQDNAFAAWQQRTPEERQELYDAKVVSDGSTSMDVWHAAMLALKAIAP